MTSEDGPGRQEDAPSDRDGWAEVVPLRRADRDTPLRRTDPALGLRDLIGEVLRDERHRQERTLADVADGAAVSLQYLSEVERGRKDVSSELLRAMHEALGLELSDVLERAVRRLEVRSQRDNGFRMLAA